MAEQVSKSPAAPDAGDSPLRAAMEDCDQCEALACTWPPDGEGRMRCDGPCPGWPSRTSPSNRRSTWCGCGACTVIAGGRRIVSCLSLAVHHDGCEVTTIEGIDGSLQAAFVTYDGSSADTAWWLSTKGSDDEAVVVRLRPGVAAQTYVGLRAGQREVRAVMMLSSVIWVPGPAAGGSPAAEFAVNRGEFPHPVQP